MLRAGELDRSLILQQDQGTTKNNFGDLVASWVTIDTIRAKLMEEKVEEQIEGRQPIGSNMRTYHVRHEYGIVANKYRFQDKTDNDSKNWDVKGVQQMDRGRGLIVTAENKDNG